jgi:hypothetical protein
MRNLLLRTILGPVLPDYGTVDEVPVQYRQALRLMAPKKGSPSSEPGEADTPITENPTNDPQPS